MVLYLNLGHPYNRRRVSGLIFEVHVQLYISRYHYTKVTLNLCVRACVRVYKWEVTGSHSTQGKEVFFLGIGGYGRYNRQPTDTASYMYGPSRD